MTRKKIEKLESEKLHLAGVMRGSDEHLFKCLKQDKEFATEYPEEYSEYVSANKRYNEVEEELKVLYEQLKEEETKLNKEEVL